MSVKITEIKLEHFPEVRLIGKRYSSSPDWGEWWEKNLFSSLEKLPQIPENGDAYVGAVHIVDDMPEYWIGMFFSADTQVPDGYEYIDILPHDYAVCYLYGKEGSPEFYTMDTHNMCLDELRCHGFTRKEDDWCFERYNCPRFTTPDKDGNVILDYGVSVE